MISSSEQHPAIPLSRQRTYNVILWRAGIIFNLLGYPQPRYHFKLNQLVYGNYVARNNKPYLGLHVKFPIFLPECNQISIFSAGVKDSTISNSTKTRAVGAHLTRVDTRPDRHEDANRLFSPVYERAINSKYLDIPVKIQSSDPLNKRPEVQSVPVH